MAKVSVNIALMLEMLKRKGKTAVEIEQLLAHGDVEQLAPYEIYYTPNWQALLDWYEQEEEAKVALAEGYSVKFFTVGSLQTFLKIAYDWDVDVAYKCEQFHFRQLALVGEERRYVQQLLSSNWTFHATAHTCEIHPLYT